MHLSTATSSSKQYRYEYLLRKVYQVINNAAKSLRTRERVHRRTFCYDGILDEAWWTTGFAGLGWDDRILRRPARNDLRGWSRSFVVFSLFFIFYFVLNVVS